MNKLKLVAILLFLALFALISQGCVVELAIIGSAVLGGLVAVPP